MIRVVVGDEVKFEYLGKVVSSKITKMYLHGRTGKERLIFKIDGNIVKKYSQTVTIK